jgi:hypothetical protein
VYRWQGRAPDALSAFEAAAGLAPADPEIRDQLRSVGLGFAPDARPSLVLEDDSDGNLMLTTSAAGSWHPTPRLQLRARVYHKSLEQRLGTFTLERAARGLRVSAAFQLSPGWTFSTGVGGSTTSGTGDPSFLSGEIGVRTPERHDLVGTLTVSTSGLDETAVLAERGVRSSEVLASARWMPGPAWRFDASVGVGEYRGTEANGRRSAALGASRRLGRALALGVGLRGFSFEKNLFDGYFDPDFYGLAELTGSWLHRPGSWTFVVELAPGLQKVTLDGDVGTSLRSNARAAYALGPGREIGLSLGYSSAGLTSFATGGSGYSYTAVILSASWAF